MKFSIVYGIFCLVALALILAGCIFQWCVFGELNVYEQLAACALCVVIYIPFIAFVVHDVLTR